MSSSKLVSFAAVCLASCLLISGCSGGSGGSGGGSSAPQVYPDVSGNWGLTAASTTHQGSSTPMGVQFTESGGKVTGIAHLAPASACYLITDNVPLSGSEDYSGNLTLTSTVVNGQTLTITGNVATATSLTAGTYKITGGCTTNDAGTLTGSTAGVLSGTYSGALKSTANGATYQSSEALTQTTTVDANGLEHLSGSLTLTGSSCFTNIPIATPTTDTNIIGTVYSANFVAGAAGTVQTSGTISADAKTVTVNYVISGGTCNGDYGSGTLTKQ